MSLLQSDSEQVAAAEPRGSQTRTLQTCSVWQVWRNPIIRRFATSRLRLFSAGFWLLLTLIITLFIFLTVYVGLSVRELQSAEEAARSAILPIFIIQAIILMLMGTGRVASGIIQEKIDNTLDYTRMTPLSPASKIVGYLLGLPIREYVMVGLTLPFMLYLLWKGGIPWLGTLQVYSVLLASVWLYHLTGMVAGMVVNKWRMAARLSQGLIILLYLVLPQLSQVGLLFFEYLTVRPVLANAWLPHIFDAEDLIQNPLTWLGGRPVPFFELSVGGYFFSILVQGLLAGIFFRMLLRKWGDANAHALSKLDGVVIFSGFLALTFGNLWPTLNRQPTGVPLLFQQEDVNLALTAGIPFLFAAATLFIALVISHSITPSIHSQHRGWRRQGKLGLGRIPANWDEASAWPVNLFMAVALFLVHALTLQRMEGAGYFDGYSFDPVKLFLLPTAAALVFFIYALIQEWLGGKQRALVLLLLGLLPILSGIFIGLLSDALEGLALGVLSLSGVALLPFTALLPIISEIEGGSLSGSLPQAVAFGLAFHAVLFAVVLIFWLRHRSCVRQQSGYTPSKK